MITGSSSSAIYGHGRVFGTPTPRNWRNKYGESWIRRFYADHNTSPAEAVWLLLRILLNGAETLLALNDLFFLHRLRPIRTLELDSPLRVLQDALLLFTFKTMPPKP